HVGAGAHLVCRSHQDAYAPVSAGLVQGGLVGGLGVVVDERDAFGGDAARDEFIFDAGVDAPGSVVFRDGPVAEDDLEPATDGRFLAECVAVDGVACRIVLGEDAGGDLASTSSGGRRGQMSGAGVEADVAPVVGDLEGGVQVPALGVDAVGAVARIEGEVAHFLAGLEVHDAV